MKVPPMQTGMIRPEQLDPRATYCVVTDVQMREVTLVTGRRIQQDASTSREFRRFAPDEPIWDNHVRVDFGSFALVLWRDPSKPELHVVDGGDAGVITPVADPEAEPTPVPDWQPVAAEEPVSDEPWWEPAVALAAAHVSHDVAYNLYVQS